MVDKSRWMKWGHEYREDYILIDWKMLYSPPVSPLTIDLVKQNQVTEA